ncbi:MAG: hypothetical protein IKS20_00225, partial [Victivallales bacterium]|nr:hypothetical protein [Victivallales bacterium]
MLKSICLAASLLLASVNLAKCAENGTQSTQSWPTSGTVQLESGAYKVSFLAKAFWRISGFAHEDRQLFISNSASAGTRYEPFPKAKEQLLSVKLTVDGQMPSTVSGTIKGEKMTLE